ncbi:glycosyltransferase [Nibrella saemangeumensis]|uniref:Glycosyltransferase n=1 Tax=Nibrella saemangeumensis TaxID=1084526 RepID=A0ABP8N3S2_9BACT
MFTIVIPLYNKAHTIKDTLDSVLLQTYENYEVVIVDDGSTDEGVEVIKKYTKDQRIKIINQKNLGVSAARNLGVEKAKYEYIAFLDGDDEWKPEYLKIMKEAICEYPKAGMVCCAGYGKHKGGSTSVRIAKRYTGMIKEIDFFQNPHVFLHTSATVVKKKEFKEAGGFPNGMKRNEDFAFFFTLALQTPVVYCGIPLSIYNHGVKGQATSTESEKVISDIIERFNYVYKNWLKSSPMNISCKIFMKYEIRHYFINELRKNNYESLYYFLNNLHPGLLGMFSPHEINIYKSKGARYIGIICILLTKLRWRIRLYPRVGEV